MSDPNLKDFYGRVYKIRKNHSRGGGFEAAGTLGRAYFVPPPSRVLPVARLLRPVLFLYIVVTVLKGLIIGQIGLNAYDQHIVALMSGDSVDRIGAVIMSADPPSRALGAMFGIVHL